MRYFIIALILIISSAQTRVTPKLQACECANLLNQADCSFKNGCLWKFTVIQNSTTQSSITSGTCTKETSTPIAIGKLPTYCSKIINIIQCASTFGCALVNNTCIIFAGCSAYPKKSNAACQAISTQCTTDGISCIKQTACSTYSTKELCTKNIATSGAKTCIWNIQSQKCEDKTCEDAPRSFKTQSQCNDWIVGCLTNGKGCTINLRPCSFYQQANGCQGMIESDGQCIADPNSSICKPITCMDAPKIYSTNQACEEFQKGCLTNGKGCVSFLSPCHTYNQEQGCAGLIGSNGPCTANKIKGQNYCRVLQCTDAPASVNTNETCSRFLSGCITTGLGCTNYLKTCQTYKGTVTTCALLIGIDGKCKGSTSQVQPCITFNCEDAPATLNSNVSCNGFKSGCVTTGAGCTSSLKSCNSYSGTNITCPQYIGNDGNCTAPSTQTITALCTAKICADAPKTIQTNSACQAFSYLCVTNGAGCQQQQECETTELQITCQGQSNCALNKICLNRSSCENYLTKSQCMLNQQQYQSGGVIYLRPCKWSELLQICENIYCVSLLETLSSDLACSQALPGCLTNGIGCVEIKDPCTNYSGLSQNCENFEGINGTQKCSQLITVTDGNTPCVARTQCSQANQLSSTKQTSNASCNFFLQECLFDGKDNCTKGDCTSYYGTFDLCVSITTALSGQTPQICWKTANLNDPTTACVVKQCNLAKPESLYQSNFQCDIFLKGCVWNGQEGGGCVSPQTSCQQYYGTLSTCSNYLESNKKCTKKTGFCKAIVCTSKTPPYTATTYVQKGTYCQGFNEFQNQYNCQMGQDTTTTCVSPEPFSCTFFVAIGEDNQEKVNYCYGLKLPYPITCGYSEGVYCVRAACDQFTALGISPDLKLAYCKTLNVDNFFSCSLASETATYCSIIECAEYGSSQNTCRPQCAWSSLTSSCYPQASNCSFYKIPAEFTTTEILKAKYCGTVISKTQGCAYLWNISTTTCSDAPYCDNILIPQTIQENQESATFCLLTKNQYEISCAYSTQTLLVCAPLGNCSTYVPDQYPFLNTNLMNQIFCQRLQDASGKLCSFTTGSLYCINPKPICEYDTYGQSLDENMALCSVLKNTQNKKCTFDISGTSKCKNLVCGDISTDQSFATCNAYSTDCTFDGQDCVNNHEACSYYNAQPTGKGPQANCAALTEINGNKCGWTNGANCSNRTCEQLMGVEANEQTCADYLIGCQYNGYSCVTKTPSCSNYTPQGETDAIKASICNQMKTIQGDEYKCTYIGGTESCVDTNSFCSYKLPQPITDIEALAFCSLAKDFNGKQCGFSVGQYCTTRMCDQARILIDSDCNNFLQGCEPDSTQCSSTICSNASLTLTTNTDCAEYGIGCLTNGVGCIESTEPCSKYNGTQSICNRFIGNQIPCTNNETAISSDSCIDRTCVLNKTARSDQDCTNWYPPINGIINCVWGGTFGCVPIQPCEQFMGTVDSCPTFIASNGPCYGIGSVKTPQFCFSNNQFCTAAPKSFDTDKLCKKWGSSCMTNGFGCIKQEGATCQSIQSSGACQLYKQTPGLYCDIALQCKTRPSTCDEIFTPFECHNTPLLESEQLTCGWDVVITKCIPINCMLLPSTLVSDSQCSSVISACTTNGAGCITKGACTSYPKYSCGIAQTTDIQKACIWQNSTCRPIQCTDNTISTSDQACNTFLAGCRTSGIGCFLNFPCSIITKADLCLFDSEGQPCLWYKSSRIEGTCINYSQCSDIISPLHEECQAASPFCTTNGINCIAITSCSKTVLKVSCIIGTDGQCGWMPEIGQISASCQLYSNCSSLQGISKQQCQSWGSNCNSDGKVCIEKSTCSSYQNQIACNIGTDGICQWVAPIQNLIGICRIQICEDASTSIATHDGCVSFQAQTPCTTSGNGCIKQDLCSSYKVQAGCVKGTDGVCFWDSYATSTSVCRLKQCSDLLLTLSFQCKLEIPSLKCVSNGTNCMPISTCSSYTIREACQGGGSDGVCAFASTNFIQDVGTCTLFTKCSSADSDQMTCNSRSDLCLFQQTIVNGTNTSKCIPHTCATKAQGSTCQPVPFWDQSSYQICVLIGTICTQGNPIELKQENCYNNSVGTYTWNMNTSSCVACRDINTDTNIVDNIKGSLFRILIVFILIS